MNFITKNNHNLVHHHSCEAVRRIAYLNICYDRMQEALALASQPVALASKVQALALALALKPWPYDYGFDYVTDRDSQAVQLALTQFQNAR